MELWQLNRIKELEKQSKWFEAAQEWRKFGRNSDAEACEMIHDSIERGNEFRERAGKEPDVNENPHAWVKWYDNMTKIYNEMFRYI